jgi:3-oxoacyl-[acyl-carrier protein] reductase
MVDYGLTGKTVLVTGGSRGIGQAIAAAFLRIECRVGILSRNIKRLEEVQGKLAALGEIMTVPADVRIRDQVEHAVGEVNRRFGPIEILVNNAAITSREAFLSLTEAHWDEVMTTNVKGLLFITQAVVPSMMQRKWGRIINAASYAAWHPAVGRSIYSASKAAVIALTRAWAGELGPYEITVNAYAPGPIDTQMEADNLATGAREVTRPIALGRIGAPEEVADLVLFLASERARFLTGAVVEISGGKYVVQNPWSAWPERRGESEDNGQPHLT